MTRTLRLVLIVIGALGCGSQAPEVQYYAVRDSSGIEIVENEDHGTALSLGPLLYRIGSVDGPDALYRVSHAFLSSDGGVAIVESSSNRIRLYGPGGESIRTVGRAGRGPGEFTGLWWAAPGPADSLIVFDMGGSSSVSVFDSNGTFARSFPLPRIGRGEPLPIGLWPSGSLLVLMQSGSQQAPGEPYAWNLYSAGLDATIKADLGSWPIGIHRGALEIFAHRAQFALSGIHLLYTPGDRFEVRRYDESRTLNRISRTERSRQAVTQEHIDEFWVNLRASTAGRGNQEALLRRVGEPLFADSMPGYTSILATENLGFWARQATAPNDSIDVWDVYDERGIYLGSVTLPPGFVARDVSDRYVVGTTRDSNDVEFVEAYEWTWPERTGMATSGVHSR